MFPRFLLQNFFFVFNILSAVTGAAKMNILFKSVNSTEITKISSEVLWKGASTRHANFSDRPQNKIMQENEKLIRSGCLNAIFCRLSWMEKEPAGLLIETAILFADMEEQGLKLQNFKDVFSMHTIIYRAFSYGFSNQTLSGNFDEVNSTLSILKIPEILNSPQIFIESRNPYLLSSEAVSVNESSNSPDLITILSGGIWLWVIHLIIILIFLYRNIVLWRIL